MKRESVRVHSGESLLPPHLSREAVIARRFSTGHSRFNGDSISRLDIDDSFTDSQNNSA